MPAATPGTPDSPAAWLTHLPSASPSLLAQRSLMQRVDTKFAFHARELESVLTGLGGHYAVVRVGTQPMDRYETTYFDTAELTLFHQHLRDRRPRFKVRVRHYLGRQLSYLEVKRKDASGTTQKWRRPLSFGEAELSPESARFLGEVCPVPAHELRATACTNFDRIMLVGTDTLERVTLDLHVDLVAGTRARRLADVVIGEVKQDRQRWQTPVMACLRAHHIRPLSISKYCAATALLVDGARVQRYRPRLRELHRVVSRSESRA
ncbi:MAG: polyphosphate polymerase domain-containing protein [Polyangiales bacterium]|nr:polyphosphate polymerase domain-containing protein [Myxococcales bacterium]